jgi:hypothetical protein
MDLVRDRHLFYIAKEGLKAPLPEPWKPCKTPGGEIYYFNFEDGESVWEHPCDELYRSMFEEAKAAKTKKSPVIAKKSASLAIKALQPKNPFKISEAIALPKPKSNPKSIISELGADNYFINRENDTILKLEKEKKLN